MSLVFIKTETDPAVYGGWISKGDTRILVLIPEKEYLFDGIIPSIQTSSMERAIDIVKTTELVHYRDCEELTLHELGILYCPSVPQEQREKHTLTSILDAVKEIKEKLFGVKE